MEWLFFITKPSLFQTFTLPEAARVLFVSLFFASLPVLIIFGILAGLAFLFRPLSILNPLVLVGRLLAAFLLSVLILILVDNFTYSIFKVGIITFQGGSRLVYGGLFIGLWALLFLKRFDSLWLMKPLSRIRYAPFIVLFLGLGFALTAPSFKTEDGSPSGGNRTLPDILMISADGLEADSLAIYHPKGVKTPAIESLAQDGVVFKNVFANLSRTSGSLASVLSGKGGLTTKKLHSTHIFKGEHAYQHLPGLLKNMGYRSIQLGWLHHNDADNWNMRNAFDVINRQSLNAQLDAQIPKFLKGGFFKSWRFLSEAGQRVHERLSHIFGGPKMENRAAKSPKQRALSVSSRIKKLISFLRTNDGPAFGHVHLNRIRSSREIRAFDREVREVVSFLKKSGRYDGTLVIIYSDHGRNYRVNKPIPLIFKFPHYLNLKIPETDSFSQALDIAPTILDALQRPIPPWMEGQSLLKPRDKEKPIISVISAYYSKGVPLWGLPKSSKGGPAWVQWITHGQGFVMDLKSRRIREFNPAPRKPSNGEAGRILPENVKKDISEMMKKKGYEF